MQILDLFNLLDWIDASRINASSLRQARPENRIKFSFIALNALTYIQRSRDACHF